MISPHGDGEHVEKIDLFNFEDPRYENSRYVLTSPRSLEACSRLNVKPVELLYKPLTEFQEELLPQDVPLRTIYNIYDEQEQIRLRKLHLCREEKGRISKTDIPDTTAASSKNSAQNGKASKIASQQPQRRVWSAGTPQGRTKKDALNKRKQEGGEESAKLKRELLSRKDSKPRPPLSASRPRSARWSSKKEISQTRVGVKPPPRCKSASDIYSKLPPRDQKILELMQWKREEEQRLAEESERTRLLWEDERRRQEALRAVMDNKRRKLLAMQNSNNNATTLRDSQRLQLVAEKDLNSAEQDILSRSKQSHDALYRQLKSQELQLSEKKLKESLRKSIQERNLQHQAHDEQDMQKRVAVLTSSALRSAHHRKEADFYHQVLQRSFSNKQERLAFEQRRRELENDAKKQEKGTLSLMELRHSQAEENLTHLLESRTQQLMASKLAEEKKQEKARQTQQQLEAEMEAWRKRLLQHHRKVEKQAEVAVKVNVDTRAQRARQERLAHQQDQKKNLEKLSKEHDRWKRSLVRSLNEKDRKIIELQQQKDQYIAQTRSMAQMSQLLRDQVRNKYEHDTFDRKVLEAQIFAKLESKPMPRPVSAKS